MRIKEANILKDSKGVVISGKGSDKKIKLTSEGMFVDDVKVFDYSTHSFVLSPDNK